MVEIFVSSKGIKVKVFIPVRTEEENRKRDKEVERSLISIYKKEENAKKHLINSLIS